MKETGIIMSGDHPKLILEGKKTQTRRVIKPQPIKQGNLWEWGISKSKGISIPLCLGGDWEQLAECMLKRCPYGQVGDRLWVRETTWRGQPIATAIYDADLTESERADYWDNGWRKFPSIFLPRFYSRITLEITDIRVERVQEITISDAEAETGIKFDPIRDWSPEDCLSRFDSLWDSLNAKRGFGWEDNPWVWVIRFTEVGLWLEHKKM